MVTAAANKAQCGDVHVLQEIRSQQNDLIIKRLDDLLTKMDLVIVSKVKPTYESECRSLHRQLLLAAATAGDNRVTVPRTKRAGSAITSTSNKSDSNRSKRKYHVNKFAQYVGDETLASCTVMDSDGTYWLSKCVRSGEVSTPPRVAILSISANACGMDDTDVSAYREVLAKMVSPSNPANAVRQDNPFLWKLAEPRDKLLITLSDVLANLTDLTPPPKGILVIGLSLLHDCEEPAPLADQSRDFPMDKSADTLSSGRFTQYKCAFDEALTAGNPVTSCILVTGAIQRLLRPSFSFEPVGELPIVRTDPSWSTETVVFRVWCPLPNTAPVNRITQHISGNERWLPADDEADAAAAARELVRQLQLRSATDDTLVLHWQCHSLRKHDLLTPVAESLRPLVGLDRRYFFPHNTPTDFDVVAAISDWTKKEVNHTSNADQIRESLQALLLGSANDDAFVGIVDRLYDLFAAMNSELRIVVENPVHADDLLSELIQRLTRQPCLKRMRLFRVGVQPKQ